MKAYAILRRLPLKRKLMLIIMITSVLGLLLAGVFFGVYERYRMRLSLVHDLTTLSRLIGDRSTAALVFDDPRTAGESLAALKVQPNVAAACIYTENGALFSSYTAEGRKVIFPPVEIGSIHRFDHDTLMLFEPIVMEGKAIGTIHIQANLDEFKSLWRQFLLATSLIVVGAGLAALFLSAKLQRVVTEPLAEIAGTARLITQNRDFSVRAVKTSDDEIALLVEAFNEMLETIEFQNKELVESNKSLEQRVIKRTEELAMAKDRAESADRVKSAFLATMSHELRTPLNSIIGFTGIILLGRAGPLNPEQVKQLEMVRGSARHLLALINDVLDISKIEAAQLEVTREPVAVRAAVEKVAGIVQPLAEKKGLALRVDLGREVDTVMSDQRRVEQVLLNLLNNAVKFTEQGAVTLRVWKETAPGSRERLHFQVRDTGIGIKPADLATLFQPFRQVDSGLTRQHEGTGLGLAICRRLAGLMGGEINVESEWGRGSVFTFTLPAEPPPKA